MYVMRRCLLAALLVLACSLAGAAERGFYVGAGVNRNEIDDVAPMFFGTRALDETAWKAIVGIRPFDFLAAELTYVDLGEETQPVYDARAEATALSAWVIGLFPLPLVDLYGKAGVARWEFDSFVRFECNDVIIRQCIGPPPPRSDSGGDVAYGAGAQVKLKRLALRLEYERFDIDDTDGAELYTLGVTWTF
jgi:hypothetical protein